MARTITALLLGLLLHSNSTAQTLGILAGGAHTELYTAGQVLDPKMGVRGGVFMPFYVHDRFVVRTELGAGLFKGRSNEGAEGMSTRMGSTLNLALLTRYYMTKKVSIAVGGEFIQWLQEKEPVDAGPVTNTPARSDIALIFAIAYRFTDRVELGARVGQGFAPALDAGSYGTAEYRYSSVMLSFLLHGKSKSFVDRRSWRNPLPIGTHY
ncbi:MAG: hypothetical protein R2818_14885 [Flavobacteriales bacterium]